MTPHVLDWLLFFGLIAVLMYNVVGNALSKTVDAMQ